MGIVYADIKLINYSDLDMAKRNIIGQQEIREITVRMMVDSGSNEMAINEDIQSYLQLPLVEKRRFILADGRIGEFDIVGPVRVKFEDRTADCDAIVLKGDTEPLLGAIPMQAMDVIIHPSRHELAGNPNHPPGGLWRL
jgi:clan AA aspartic protease